MLGTGVGGDGRREGTGGERERAGLGARRVEEKGRMNKNEGLTTY